MCVGYGLVGSRMSQEQPGVTQVTVDIRGKWTLEMERERA